MRVLVTSDLHFDHGRSKSLAEQAAEEINGLEYDVLLVVGDTATSRGDALERGLERFTFRGPRLLTFGNHELWSAEGDSLELYDEVLPRRAKNVGWHVLDVEPWRSGDVAIVGSVGWYDFSFAPRHLNIPERFYRAKVSPGSAAYYTAFRHLLEGHTDVPAEAMEIYARWNDGRHVRWGLTDEGFLERTLARLALQLDAVANARDVLAAVHHLPHAELLPPPSAPAWDFAKAYLGSGRIGELILRYPNVSTVVSGHSHFPARAAIGGKQFIATGSGYRKKHREILDL